MRLDGRKSTKVLEFSKFEVLIEGLDTLSNVGNSETRSKAFLLHSAATKPNFIVSVFIIAKYSALLEPVVNALQAKSLDLLKCADHIKTLTSIIKKHREDIDEHVVGLLEDANTLADKIDIELKVQVGRRLGHPATTFADYCKRAIFIPYLDSLISALSERFSNANSPAFALHSLHPKNMMKLSIEDLSLKIGEISDFYGLASLKEEIDVWYEIWKNKELSNEELDNLDMLDLIIEAETFFPNVKNALHISMAQPCTTCSIERSFSTLRRVKTWLRSSMGENRLNGLCMLSVHRDFVAKHENMIEEVLDKFSNNKRRLVL